MKPFYTTRHEQVLTDIQKLEYQIKVLKAELTELVPLAEIEKAELQAERSERAKNIQVEIEGGVFVTTEQFEKIQKGELVVETKRPKKVKEDKTEPTEPVEPQPTEPTTETSKKKSWLKR